MKTAHDIILKPVITENSMAGIADKKYTFKAVSYTHLTANMTPRETRASNLIECLLQLDLDVHASGELEEIGRAHV